MEQGGNQLCSQPGIYFLSAWNIFGDGKDGGDLCLGVER